MKTNESNEKNVASSHVTSAVPSQENNHDHLHNKHNNNNKQDYINSEKDSTITTSNTIMHKANDDVDNVIITNKKRRVYNGL